MAKSAVPIICVGECSAVGIDGNALARIIEQVLVRNGRYIILKVLFPRSLIRDEENQTLELSANVQAVFDDFRNWAVEV